MRNLCRQINGEGASFRFLPSTRAPQKTTQVSCSPSRLQTFLLKLRPVPSTNVDWPQQLWTRHTHTQLYCGTRHEDREQNVAARSLQLRLLLKDRCTDFNLNTLGPPRDRSQDSTHYFTARKGAAGTPGTQNPAGTDTPPLPPGDAVAPHARPTRDGNTKNRSSRPLQMVLLRSRRGGGRSPIKLPPPSPHNPSPAPTK